MLPRRQFDLTKCNPDICLPGFLLGFAIPGSHSIVCMEENARGVEIQLMPEAVQDICKLTEAVEVQGDRDRFEFAHCSLPLVEWKGE